MNNKDIAVVWEKNTIKLDSSNHSYVHKLTLQEGYSQCTQLSRHKASLAAEFFPQLSTILGIKIEQTQQIKISPVTKMKQN